MKLLDLSPARKEAQKCFLTPNDKSKTGRSLELNSKRNSEARNSGAKTTREQSASHGKQFMSVGRIPEAKACYTDNDLANYGTEATMPKTANSLAP